MRLSFGYSLLMITVLAALLRLWGMDVQSFWVDEFFSIRNAARIYTLPLEFGQRIVGYVPILISLLASGADVASIDVEGARDWHQAGISVWAARLAPCLLGIVSVPLLGQLSRRMLGDRAALIFALLLSLSWWHIFWSGSARFYTLQLLCAGLMFFLYYDSTRTGSRWKMLVACLALIVAYNAQYTSVVLFGVVVADLAFCWWRRIPLKIDGVMAVTMLATLGFCVAMVFAFVSRDVAKAANDFGGGDTPLRFFTRTVIALGPSVFLAAVIAPWIDKRWLSRRNVYLYLGLFVPLLAMTALSFRDHSGPRYAFVALGPCLALAALAVVHCEKLIRRRGWHIPTVLPLLLTAASLLVTTANYFSDSHGFRPRWQEASAYVAAQVQPQETVSWGGQKFVGQYLLGELGPRLQQLEPGVRAASASDWIVVNPLDPLSGSAPETGYREVASFPHYSFWRERSRVTVYRREPGATRVSE